MRFKLTWLFLSIIVVSNVLAQNISYQFDWDDSPLLLNDNGQRLERWRFEDAKFLDNAPSLPQWVYRIDAPLGTYSVEVQELLLEDFPNNPSIAAEQLASQLSFDIQTGQDADGAYVKLACIPILQTNNGLQRVKSFRLQLNRRGQANTSNARGPNTTVSVLSDGAIYKIAVTEDGVYRLSYDFLKDDLGIADLDNIDPRSIRLYGNGGGFLSYFISNERPDDLIENPIFISGEGDGSFDSGDFILFYGQGPSPWSYNVDNDQFNRQTNIYDTRNYYFIKIGAGNGARIEDRSSLSSIEAATDSYDYLDRFEEEKVNILRELPQPTGSAQRWYGDFFKISRDKDYPNIFTVPDFVAGENAIIRARMALRSNRNSTFTLSNGNNTVTSNTASGDAGIGTNNEVTSILAKDADAELITVLDQEGVSLSINYPFPAGARESEGWLDFFQIRARRSLMMQGDQLPFRDSRSINFNTYAYQIETTNNNVEIWDVTNPLAPVRQAIQTLGLGFQFGVASNGFLREFVAFRSDGSFLSAEAIGAIPNQNLHGITEADLLLIYHPDFEASANQLAQHRANHSNMLVENINIEQVYNEFSGGSIDPSAIRDFGKMIFDRAPDRFRYILLLGDGSYDSRNIYNEGTNFLPVYSNDVHSELGGYPADDYFVIYGGASTSNPLSGDLTVSVGRLPVKTVTEAEIVVNKIITYDTDPNSFADWRSRMIFVGDDEDNATHSDDADLAARQVEDQSFNLNKLYFDLFPQESTPGGDRFPAVTEQLNRNIFRGAALVTYMGHGGPKGWAQERVLSVPDIRSWRNEERLPVFITATCTFAGYDDPEFVSAGEEIILSRQGGASALLTTTRPVFAQRNSVLTNNSIREIMTREADGDYPRLGDIIRRAKNRSSSSSSFNNERKFTLLGDPSMQIALPRFQVFTSAINGTTVGTGVVDTLSALEQVEISGYVAGDDGQILEDFNGIVFPTVFDKAVRRTTLGQDVGSSERTYTIQNNVIFKGRASVVNGRFTFSFVAPRDIDLSFGEGKISYYAADPSQRIDAAGYYDQLIIGGTDPSALADNQGPQVEVFMNSEDFIFGGTTDANPTLLVKLSDDNGINVAGNSIGHDLEGVLDEDTRNTLLLNEFYEAEIDDYTRGEVRFPLENLSPGLHRISVKAWDVANNSAEGYTEFVVAEDGRLALERVLNYPNPFTDRTCFQFDHNLAGQDLQVMIQIYTISGRLVKTIRQDVNNQGAMRLDNCIEWDGRDEYGDQLARGVYLYKVSVRVPASDTSISAESEFEKLVILK